MRCVAASATVVTVESSERVPPRADKIDRMNKIITMPTIFQTELCVLHRPRVIGFGRQCSHVHRPRLTFRHTGDFSYRVL